jgi:two-component system, NarL family, sensor histidine kinase DesK
MSRPSEDARHWWTARGARTFRGMTTSNADTICRPGRVTLAHWAAPVFGVAWVALPIPEFVDSDPTAWQIALVAVGLPLFAYLFLSGVIGARMAPSRLAGMLVIAVALTLGAVDTWGLLFAYPASAAAVQFSPRNSVIAVGAITALAAATMVLTGWDGHAFWGITALVFGTGTLWLLIGGLIRANVQLREARAELAELAVAEERARFSRDLHDLLGHDLSLIALKAELAGKLLPRQADRAAGEVEDIRDLTRSALTQVREAVEGYRRPTLASELNGARLALEAAGIDLRVENPGLSLDPEVESVLAWAVREGATNVIRHSGAHRATIALRPGPAGTELEVSDDGGAAGSADGSGHGLDGLRERAELVGGSVDAGWAPAGGFRLRLNVPAGERVA